MANAFLVRPLAPAAVTAEGSAAGTSPANLADDMLGVVHRGTGSSAGWVVVDFGAAQSVDFASFLAVNALTSARQRVRAASTQAALTSSPGYDSGTIDLLASSSWLERPNTWWEVATPQAFRWWRFDISSLEVPFEAARLVIGRRILLSRNFDFGLSLGHRDLGGHEFSTAGVLLQRAGGRLRPVEIKWAGNTRDEAEADLAPAIHAVGSTHPLLLVTDPAAATRRSDRMFFGPLENATAAQVQRAFNRWEWKTTLQSMI